MDMVVSVVDKLPELSVTLSRVELSVLLVQDSKIVAKKSKSSPDFICFMAV